MVEVREGRTCSAPQAGAHKGLTAVPIDVVVPTPGSHVLRAAITLPDDPILVNNTLDRGSGPNSREGASSKARRRARYLADALTSAGMEVTVQPPSALPVTSEALTRGTQWC